ncbi:Noc2p family-domain-containing protein [Cokeromyces recurvatus]|uniref:Noc2p family-domain-containing protein n=1 Tax=Cokeromyces recurvatus TaxID=90255 RepID=UPI0022210862|nr:Noc2p family-domain-containing protein [Cokeromyces recurvatus]KAI7898298.1 Noc2p family-domain-containing protein [Cokeromyces recurvatus]
MGTKEKKSTIKFQKNKLKSVLKRRKESNKLKRQIIKRQLRRGKKDPYKNDEEEEIKETKAEDSIEEVPQVNVEDYFCNFVLETDEPLELSDDEADLDGLDAFEGIEAPKQNDELQEDVDMSEADDNNDDDEEEEYSDEFEDEDENDEINDEDDDTELVTMAMLNEWSAAAFKKSPTAWKKMLMAFRYVVRSDEHPKIHFTYRVESSKVYTKLIRNTLKAAYPILSQHIYFLKKEKYPGRTKNWPKLEKTIQLFLNNCVRFLRELSEDDIIQYVLEQLEPCTLYFGPFAKLSREYLRVLLDRWSDVALSEETRHQCYKAIRQLGTAAIDANRKNYMPNVLKGVYLIFANRSTKINEASLPVIQQMLEEAADIYTIDPNLSYEHVTIYIRQLADHLKQAKKQKTIESFKQIYTWQYISCLDFWANVIGVTCDPTMGENSAMQTLVHPLVEVILHTIRLNPTLQFLPLRIHLIRTLTGFVDATGYYIPLAPFLFEILSSDVFKNNRLPEQDLPDFDWSLHLKTPKSYLQSKNYQDAVFNVMYDCLIDFYACHGLSIAFPELAIPAIDKLKEYLIKMKGTRFVKSIRTLIERMETHKNYIEQKRAPIEYTPNKLEEANAFLRTTDFAGTPFGNFLKKRTQQKEQQQQQRRQ